MTLSPLTGLVFANEREYPYWTTQRDYFLALDTWVYSNYEDKSLILSGGGIITLVGNTLSWSAAMYLSSLHNGSKITIAANSATVLDGQVVYVTVSSRPISDQTLTLSVGNPTTLYDIPIGRRIGTVMYLRDIGAGSGMGPDSIDDAYDNFIGIPAVVDVDNAQSQGDLRFKCTGAFSTCIDLEPTTGTADGFQIYDTAAEYWRVVRKSDAALDIEAQVQAVGITASSTYGISCVGYTATSTDADLTIRAATGGGAGGNLALQNDFATKDITFNARSSGAIPFNEAAPDNALVGYTATSVIGSLNEAMASISATTLDVAYNNDGGAATITVDAGDVSWAQTGAYSFIVDLSAITGTADGFFVNNGSDYFRLTKNGANVTDWSADLGAVTLASSSAQWTVGTFSVVGAISASTTISATTAKLSDLTDGYLPYHVSDAAGLADSGLYWSSGNSALGIGTADFDGTPPIGKLVVKGSTNDGSTNCLVLRDSDEANVLWIDTDGGIHTDQWLGQDSNTFIGVGVAGTGTLAHTASDDGWNITSVGFQSLYSITTGGSLNAVGYQALYNNTTGSRSVGQGHKVLYSNVDGSFLTAYGYNALYSNVSGNYSEAVGYQALKYTVGSFNCALGSNAGLGQSGLSVISNNTLVGYRSGYALLTGANSNCCFGYLAGDNITTGASNIIIGPDCDAPSATGSNQLNIGNTIYGDLSSTYVGIGTYDFDGTPAVGTLTVKGDSNNGSTNCLVLRDSDEANVLWVDTDGGIHTDQWLGQDSNTFIGVDVAGAGNLAHTAGSEGYTNTALGNKSMYSITLGYNNTAFGTEALYSLTTGYENCGIGRVALYSNDVGYNNVAVGTAALFNNIGGNNNVSIGNSSSRLNSSGTQNTAIGANAAYYNETGTRNVSIGWSANYGSSGASNVNYTTCVGFQAGYILQTGANYNTCVGYQAGDNITTGASNIIIGASCDAPSATGSNQLNIGNTIYGDLSSAYVGIGTYDFDGTPAVGKLIVKGSTNDGSTNCLVLRDSDEANVVSVDTNGNEILSGYLSSAYMIGGTDSITATSETVAASVSTLITEITTNGDTDLDNVSLANGVDGQVKIFAVVAVGNAADSVKITPANMIGGTQITFAASPLGLGCTMVYDSGAGGWIVTGNNGGTIA